MQSCIVVLMQIQLLPPIKQQSGGYSVHHQCIRWIRRHQVCATRESKKQNTWSRRAARLRLIEWRLSRQELWPCRVIYGTLLNYPHCHSAEWFRQIGSLHDWRSTIEKCSSLGQQLKSQEIVGFILIWSMHICRGYISCRQILDFMLMLALLK